MCDVKCKISLNDSKNIFLNCSFGLVRNQVFVFLYMFFKPNASAMSRYVCPITIFSHRIYKLAWMRLNRNSNMFSSYILYIIINFKNPVLHDIKVKGKRKVGKMSPFCNFNCFINFKVLERKIFLFQNHPT